VGGGRQRRQSLLGTGLPDAGLADEDHAARAVSDQRAGEAAQLLPSADQRRQPSGPRQRGEITTEAIERRGAAVGERPGWRPLCQLHQRLGDGHVRNLEQGLQQVQGTYPAGARTATDGPPGDVVRRAEAPARHPVTVHDPAVLRVLPGPVRPSCSQGAYPPAQRDGIHAHPGKRGPQLGGVRRENRRILRIGAPQPGSQPLEVAVAQLERPMVRCAAEISAARPARASRAAMSQAIITLMERATSRRLRRRAQQMNQWYESRNRAGRSS
jgi:hypothetical protein